MGDILSRPSQSNPSATATMTTSNSSQVRQPESESEPTHLPKSPESETPVRETPDPPTDSRATETKENTREKETLLGKFSEDSIKEEDGDEEEEEEGECGFCLFMKGGGCKDTFTEWEKCVEEGEKNKEDIVEKCFQATSALKKCMEAHTDYYAPILQAEKAAEDEAVKQLEEEKEKEKVNNHERIGEESEKMENEEALDGSEKKETS